MVLYAYGVAWDAAGRRRGYVPGLAETGFAGLVPASRAGCRRRGTAFRRLARIFDRPKLRALPGFVELCRQHERHGQGGARGERRDLTHGSRDRVLAEVHGDPVEQATTADDDHAK